VADTRGDYEHLQAIYLPIAVGVFVLVSALVVFAALRWRRRDDRVPTQRTGAPILEGAYAVGLAAVAAFLVGATFHTETREDRVGKRPGLDVHVTAAKWRWRFDYPALGISEVGTDRAQPTLALPAGTTVRLTLGSQDVIHSFWIPNARFKRDAFPYRLTRFDLRFDQVAMLAGGGACSEFCGLRHTDMRFSVDVLSPRDFAAWARAHRQLGSAAR
jgi:cytochrome c oxidase subunit 2